MKNDSYHESVMTSDVISTLNIKPNDKIIDATLGTGGHTLEILKLGARVLGIERDSEMLAIAKRRLEISCPTSNFKLVNANFDQIDKIAKENDFDQVDAVLFDLGVSNLQLTSTTRGFSFSNPDAELDMRIDQVGQSIKASDLLNILRQDQLVDLFSKVLTPGESRWIAKRIVERREHKKSFARVRDLSRALEGFKFKPTLNPITLPMLALRIAVNYELESFKAGIIKAYELLKKDGLLLVITFHSGEDQVINDFKKNILILPSSEEINANPRSRSAKLRVIKKNE